MSDILNLHTLSDPTDRHSLDELRAHPVSLADSGDVEHDTEDMLQRAAEDAGENAKADIDGYEILSQMSPKLRQWLDKYEREIYLYDLDKAAFCALDYETYGEFQALCDTYDLDTVADALGEASERSGGDGR